MSNTKIQLKRTNKSDLSEINLAPGECLVSQDKNALIVNTGNEDASTTACTIFSRDEAGTPGQAYNLKSSTLNLAGGGQLSSNGVDVFLQNTYGGSVDIQGSALKNVGSIIFSTGGSGNINSPGYAQFDDYIQTGALKIHTNTDAGNYWGLIAADENGINTGAYSVTSKGAILVNATEAAHAAMPSSVVTNYTLGASGSEYTAISDGYVCVRLLLDANGNFSIQNKNTGLGLRLVNPPNTFLRAGFIPVSMGDVVTIAYNGLATSNDNKIFQVGLNGHA